MTGRQSPVVHAARLVQRLPLSWLRPLESPLMRLHAGNADRPQLVILLALPRSGSTLTYQALIHALQPFYLSNLWNLLYALPWMGGVLSGRRCAGHRSDFRSSHGFVEGVCGPAEGLRFWSYWTGIGLNELAPPAVPPSRLDKRVRYLHQIVAALSDPARPLVTAYLGHVLITEQLRSWFPEAVFLRLHRDPLSNAASILRSRQRGPGNWFSVFPRECEEVVDANVPAQVASQVYWLNRRLDSIKEDERTIHMSYEDLCNDPNSEIRRLVNFCNGKGMRLEIRETLPKSFSYQLIDKKEDEEIADLWRELKKLESQYGKLRVASPKQ